MMVMESGDGQWRASNSGGDERWRKGQSYQVIEEQEQEKYKHRR